MLISNLPGLLGRRGSDLRVQQVAEPNAKVQNLITSYKKAYLSAVTVVPTKVCNQQRAVRRHGEEIDGDQLLGMILTGELTPAKLEETL